MRLAHRPPPKRAGQATGPRRLNGFAMDVAATASFLGDTEKGTRAKIARGLLPYHRLGSRVICLRDELEAYLRQLPGITAAEAIKNIARRQGDKT